MNLDELCTISGCEVKIEFSEDRYPQFYASLNKLGCIVEERVSSGITGCVTGNGHTPEEAKEDLAVQLRRKTMEVREYGQTSRATYTIPGTLIYKDPYDDVGECDMVTLFEIASVVLGVTKGSEIVMNLQEMDLSDEEIIRLEEVVNNYLNISLR